MCLDPRRSTPGMIFLSRLGWHVDGKPFNASRSMHSRLVERFGTHSQTNRLRQTRFIPLTAKWQCSLSISKGEHGNDAAAVVFCGMSVRLRDCKVVD